MPVLDTGAITTRFLRPAYAVAPGRAIDWSASAVAETPGEDACCRVFLALDDKDALRAAFAAFGPPVVIACADWLCEQITGQGPDKARTLTLADVEEALALTPTQRYAGLVAIDALANALVNLGR